jgi:hypothetical protein
MLAPGPTKLRSQRDINLGRIPLQLSLAHLVDHQLDDRCFFSRSYTAASAGSPSTISSLLAIAV